MKTVVIIFNRCAGDGKSFAMLAEAQRESSYRWVTIDCAHAETLSKELPALDPSSTAAIVVFGGDGTLNRCLPFLRNCRIPVYIFPAGTVNDLAFQLGFKPDWKEVVSVIDQARHYRLQLLEANGFPFAIYGSVGFGADMSRYMHRTRGFLKPLRRAWPSAVAPLLTLVAILFSPGPTLLRISADVKTFEILTWGLYIANRSHFNRTIDLGWNPESVPGTFRVVIFKAMSRRALCRAMIRFGRLRRIEAIRDMVEVIDTSKMLIESVDGGPLRMFGEGEPVAESPRLNISISNRPLLLFMGNRG